MASQQNQAEVNCAVLKAIMTFCSKPLSSAEASKILQDLEVDYGSTARKTAEAKIEETLKSRLGMS